jgi:RecB family exonuclease
MSPLRLSFSAIDTYRECPRQYRFRYVYRLPVAPSAEGQYGDIAHLTLQRLGTLRQQVSEIDEELFERVYTEAWAERPFADIRRRPAYERLGRLQISRYLAAGGLAEAPAFVEQSFTADLDGWSLRGIIDRVDPLPSQKGGGRSLSRDEPNGVRIVDYKTGHPLPASRLKRDLQLSLYALGAQRALGLAAVELEIVYLKEGKSVVVEAPPELLADAERTGREVAGAIRAGRFEARPERRRCSLCAYRLACDEAL